MTPPASSEDEALELVGAAIWDRIQQLIGQLRRAGAEVSLSEVLDAAEALRHINMSDRALLRIALRSALVKSPHLETIFDQAFDRSFPARPPTRDRLEPAEDGDEPARPALGADQLADRIRSAVVTDDDELRVLAEEAVRTHSGIDTEAKSERYHVYRVLRALDLARLVHEVMRRGRERGQDPSRTEVAERVDELRRLITDEVRARLLDAEMPYTEGDLAGPFDIELARANAEQLELVRAAIRPLARRLAARLRRRRQSRTSGRIDMRRTIRRSIASGGVPFDVLNRKPHAQKPEVFSLCDVSGSVADFAGFTLTLLSALADELANTRSFAFVDAIDEITRLVEDSSGVIEPWQILQNGKVIGADGHSDYGAVLEAFWSRWGRSALSDRATVIITGDARTNYRPAGVTALEEISRRARSVYWLNPEPHEEWDTSDSALSVYAPHCTEVLEVRTLRQLSNAVERML